MSHHDQNFLKAPRMVSFAATAPTSDETTIQPGAATPLLVKGQGTFTFRLKSQEPFSLIPKDQALFGEAAFRLKVTETEAMFQERLNGKWQNLKTTEEETAVLDPEPACIYWLSIDSLNRMLRFGKGEMRKQLTCLAWDIPGGKIKPDPYAWLHQLKEVITAAGPVEPQQMWRDPVTTDPPLLVVSMDAITMDQVAANEATVPANLSLMGQKLYNNVAGANFTLETKEFPQFAKAVEMSIADTRGWCYNVLAHKDEFGDPDETYLRITMGMNQGESPGIPYVMEIWPWHKSSPKHNHAGANAIIRVLHGEITVSLYAMLSEHPIHQKEFATAVFKKGDVTWISPQLNQNHRLQNLAEDGSTCITIQCYMYDESNLTHYEYFDYLNDQNIIEQFTPNSDADFREFKAQMKKEWDDWYSKEQPEAIQTSEMPAVGVN